jgi:hypothetical protein
MITAVPVPPPAGPLVRMVFLAAGPGVDAAYRAWIERMGPCLDGRVVAPCHAGPELAGPDRPVPTVLVAAGETVRAGLELCRTSRDRPDRLIIAPSPAAESAAGEPVDIPVIVLACETDAAVRPGLVTAWRRLTREQLTVKVFGTDARGLLSPSSPAVPALTRMFRIDPGRFGSAGTVAGRRQR